ncbi:MAG: sodium:solute symporter [Oscillospiraceae bacterium]|nr:sodium:solute symporter [Oscillospiraceae bacterium]
MEIKLIMLVVFFAIMIGVGFYCRRHATDVNGFVLGGRSVGPWLTAFAYGTTYFSAVIFVGYAGQFGWKFGVSATWIGIGNAVLGSLLAWVVLGRRTRLMTHHFESATMPEFFGKRFDSKTLKVIASLIVFIFLIPYTASLYNGLSRLFGMAFDIDYTVCIIIMAVLTGIYVIAGGYMATAINDFIQGIIMLAGIVAVISAVLKTNGGFLGSLDALSKVTDETVSTSPGIFASFFGPDPLSLLGVIILTSLGTWGLPQMVQKFYAIKSEKDIKKGAVISTIFAIVIAGGCYFMGGFGRLFSTSEIVSEKGFDSIIPSMLSNFSPVLIGLIVILVLSASMSTLSSLVMASSSTLTLDFIKPLFAPKMADKKQLFSIRVLIVVFILISVIIAVFQYRTSVTFIAQLMGISWGALAGSFLAPFLLSLYWKRTTKAAVFTSFAFGSGVMILNLLFRLFKVDFFPAILVSPINCGAFVMLAGFIIVPVVSLLTKAPDKKLIEDAFSCYDTTVVVTAKHALSD